MRVVRGRADTPAQDIARTASLVDDTRDSGQSTLRVWRPHRSVAFGRRDTLHDRYDEARDIAAEHGYTPVERSVGGNAVAFTGNTVSFVRILAIEDSKVGIQERYDRTKDELQAALEETGVAVERGEPDGTFCPGCHSLSATGKIVGLGQRVHREVAVVSGVVIVSDHEAIADVLEPVYQLLDLPLRREAIGSLARAGGSAKSEEVRRAVEDALAPEATEVEELRGT